MRHAIPRTARQRRAALDTQFARLELARSLGALVDTLAQAHALAAGGTHGSELADLLARARGELDLADEKLLALDRNRQRSLFRRAGRIRSRISLLQQSLARRDS
jgi:hypothetical protein